MQDKSLPTFCVAILTLHLFHESEMNFINNFLLLYTTVKKRNS